MAENKLLLSVREAAALLSIGRNLCYDLIAQGQLPHVRLGRRVLVSRQGLEAWIAQQGGFAVGDSSVVDLQPTNETGAKEEP